MGALSKATKDEILAVHGLGEAIADSVAAWFSDAGARKLLDKLRHHGLTFDEPSAATGGARASALANSHRLSSCSSHVPDASPPSG